MQSPIQVSTDGLISAFHCTLLRPPGSVNHPFLPDTFHSLCACTSAPYPYPPPLFIPFYLLLACSRVRTSSKILKSLETVSARSSPGPAVINLTVQRLDTLNPRISALMILLNDFHTILTMLVPRIWYGIS